MYVNTEMQIGIFLSEYHKTHFLCHVTGVNWFSILSSEYKIYL